MAPEIINCVKNGQYSNKSDVWALGITAIELADGKDPFTLMNPMRIMFQVKIIFPLFIRVDIRNNFTGIKANL